MSWEHGNLIKKLDELYAEIEVNNLHRKSIVSRMTVEGQENIESLINEYNEIIRKLHICEGQIIDMMRHLKGAREEWEKHLLKLQKTIVEMENARDNDIALLKDNAISFMSR